MLHVRDQNTVALPQFESGYLNIKVNTMKSTILATAILFSLAAPVSVLAELPAVTEALPETAVVTTEVIELQVAPETRAEAVAPATTMVEEQAAAEAPSEMIAEDATASGKDSPRKPCLMQGKGMMGKGMGPGGKGPGCRKQGCDHLGKGQQNKQGQLVRRLDLIDARLDKIEAMLESLMQR